MLMNSSQMRIMQTGLNALSTQQQVILHNLANYETPNYKSKTVVFEEVLKETRSGKKAKAVDAKVVTDESAEVRPDGNSVNADMESMKLYENYVQQLYIYQKINSQINNYRYVLKSAPK